MQGGLERAVDYMPVARSLCKPRCLFPLGLMGTVILLTATTIVLCRYLQVTTDKVVVLELMISGRETTERICFCCFTADYSTCFLLSTCRCVSPLAQTSTTTSSKRCFVPLTENAPLPSLLHLLWCE